MNKLQLTICWLVVHSGTASFGGAVELGIPNTTTQIEEETVLDVRIEAFRVSDQNMFGALRALRSTNPSRILIGFESIPARRDEEQYRISLELTDKSVKYVLHQLIQRDPRYTYELTGSQLVNIYPKNAKEDPDDLLNIRVETFVVDDEMWPHDAVHRISIYAAELREFLARKRGEHLERLMKAGVMPPGSAGASMSGNAPKPRMTLELKDVTVREILNSIALYTAAHAKEIPGGNPVSWHYDFILDPHADTGLGGYPLWSTF